MKNKKTRRFKIRYIVFGLLGVMALAALVFMRFGGFGTGENVNPEEFLAYAEPVENITVPESAKIIALGEATHGNAEFQQLKLEVFKLMVKNNGVRAFALEGDYGGCSGFTDGEIFGQAIHYYEENEIEVGKPMACQVVVNHVVELTEEEKAEARQNAVRRYQEEELRKLQNRNRPSARKENHPQPSLFDLGL